MPCGGHMGKWVPTPKDIFKSRWKRFYKRSYRPRTRDNRVDAQPPHRQGFIRFQEKTGSEPNAPLEFKEVPVPPDGVSSPWRLLYSVRNFHGNMPPDARGRTGFGEQLYQHNFRRFLAPGFVLARTASGAPAPWKHTALDTVLRGLDPGRRGRWDSGLGRAEMSTTPFGNKEEVQAKGPGMEVPAHILKLIEGEINKLPREHGSAAEHPFGDALLQPKVHGDNFPVRRLYDLCEEQELVWRGGQVDWRNEGNLSSGDRGHFPHIDEQASLIEELTLKNILRLAHKTNLRRHPKWLEIRYWYKKNHKQYLRRRKMNEDEVKARLGVMKQVAA